jgi:hypothetical protein
MKQRFRRLLFGSPESMAGTVYGTIVVLAALTAGSAGKQAAAWELAVVVAGSVIVLWIAHFYSHALAESLERGRRLDRAEVVSVARRELAIPAAAAAPIAVLVLGALGVLRESTAIWIAVGIGVATLGVEGGRFAALERVGRGMTVVVVALNILLGLSIVALKALLTH